MKRVLAIGLLASCGLAHGDRIYKCTGPDGAVTLSQTRCAPDAQRLDVDVARPSAEDAMRAQQRGLDARFEADRIRDEQRRSHAEWLHDQNAAARDRDQQAAADSREQARSVANNRSRHAPTPSRITAKRPPKPRPAPPKRPPRPAKP